LEKEADLDPGQGEGQAGIEAILTPHAAEGKVAPLRQRAPKVNP